MKKAFIFLLFIFFNSMLSLYYGWYLKWPWFDIILHFSGGFFMAMFMADYLKSHLLYGERIKNTLIVVGATIFIGVVWEFAEYIANQTLIDFVYNNFGIRAYFMGDLNDTVADLMLDTVGALTAFLMFSRKSSSN